jgi:hypothetical protein
MAETGDGTQGLARKSTPVSIPPTPFSHKGRRGRLGVLMAETGDGTQGLAKKSTPVSCPFSHEGRRGSLGVLMPETGDGTQGLPEKPTLSRMPWSPGSGASLCGARGAAAYPDACGSARSKGRPRPLEAAHPCAARGEQRRIPMPVVLPDQKDALVPWKRRIPVQRAGSSGVS